MLPKVALIEFEVYLLCQMKYGWNMSRVDMV